ncbi:MAG: redoxin domain-containing protein [Acidimicrobiia bacterium]|nr:redoxin domain-containing protein [Acidimicrobiia bacterium]MYC57056.1 redoxin domain-containing protein [Acidimicrobiia bacterium]MYG93663.1 redoxin domain-containing protein [Acidimicrobiia bacterium]MYI30133.1 redoxin domain-containing protein [Acidimicrobiia bacterium]
MALAAKKIVTIAKNTYQKNTDHMHGKINSYCNAHRHDEQQTIDNHSLIHKKRVFGDFLNKFHLWQRRLRRANELRLTAYLFLRSRPLLAIAGLLAALLLLAAACGSDNDNTTSQAPAPQVVESAPIAFEGYQADDLPVLLEGQKIPSITGTTINGSPFEWVSGTTPTVMVFLAHWCPACRNEVAELTRWLDDGNSLPEGVDFFSVSTLVHPDRDNYPPSQWLKDEKWPFDVLVDDPENTLSSVFGLTGTPFWVIIDGNGFLSIRSSGQLRPENLHQLFQKVLAS